MKKGIPEKILVGDNNLPVARDTFMILPESVQVDYVGKPEEFLEKAREGGYDWLVTDLCYNTKDGEEGFDVLRQLQEIPAAKCARIILFTSFASDPDVVKKGEELGAEVHNRSINDIIFEVLDAVDAIEGNAKPSLERPIRIKMLS